ncbi:trans-1,2-dihydrobenzene-1,2-diol dehydrogenase [Meleagris gallopavo]|uniref:Trans-1,2-dihydrobenzene-1,2-diol dehydrogenase n=1 Tax=Meleagris gallopavo TaxID=9103 RepID=A0A803YB51_MELGA|nr:trans-1,2-dihydrobenzene-1,2-diol dehydrogenase [Meleagris gallopavo]
MGSPSPHWCPLAHTGVSLSPVGSHCPQWGLSIPSSSHCPHWCPFAPYWYLPVPTGISLSSLVSPCPHWCVPVPSRVSLSPVGSPRLQWVLLSPVVSRHHGHPLGPTGVSLSPLRSLSPLGSLCPQCFPCPNEVSPHRYLTAPNGSPSPQSVLLAPSGVSFSLTGFSLSPLVSPHPPAPDVVYVGTVNPQHLPDTLLFLRARKAVLVEKPMGISAREAKEMAAAAREAGVFLMEGFWTRFFPAWKRLKALVDEGALGECRVLQGALAFPLRSVERVREPSLAGGALLDLGGYGLQIGQRLVGEGVPTPTATGRGLPAPLR